MDLTANFEEPAMRVTREKAEANRDALVQTAGLLLRERGIDGVGVAEIAKAAGLTSGALYAHFPSKEALAAEAFTQGLERSRDAIRAANAGRKPSLPTYLDYLLSPERIATLGMGCPMTASASEVGRQGAELSARFAKGFLGKAAAFEAVIDRQVTAPERRRLSLTVAAAEIGALAAARAVAKADPDLAEEVLKSVRAVLLKAARPAPKRKLKTKPAAVD